MVRGNASAAALQRAARACDDVIHRILEIDESGYTGQAGNSVPPVHSNLYDLIGFSPRIAESVSAFLEEFQETRNSPNSSSNSNSQKHLAKTLVHLEKALLDLKQAVEWTAKNSGENWWMKRRQKDLGLESFVMLSYPGNGQEWLTSPMMVDEYRRLVDLHVLSLDTVNLDALSRLRILKVPQFDGMHARWHPISLGHEVAHLVFDGAWVDKKLRSLRTETEYKDSAAVIGATQEMTDRPVWYPLLVSWLIETACDTCCAWFYGEEGINALEAFLAIDLELPTKIHPSPATRLAIQRGEELNLPIAHVSPHEASCRRAFASLAAKIVEFARQDLQQITAGAFSLAESDRVLSLARSALQGKYSPPSQEWPAEARLSQPSSIESGLVRALWSKNESAADNPQQQGYYVETVSGCNRVEQAVNALQFAHLFAREINLDSSTSLASGKAEDGLRVPSVLWVNASGITMTPPQGISGGRTAYDVRLGRHFIVFRRNRITSLDFLAESALVEQLQEMVEIAWGKSLILHPGELVLGATFESLVVADDACAQVLSRSSLGRLGLLAATAVHVQPGFRGNLTLELVNLTSVPLRLSPGQRIAQIVAFSATGDREEYIGDYQDANWKPRFSKVGRDVETAVLRRIDESREGRLHRAVDIGVL